MSDSEQRVRDYEDGDLIPRDAKVIYIRKDANGNSAKIIAWVAGIGAMLITASICFAASALWSFNDRLARMESKMENLQEQMARR